MLPEPSGSKRASRLPEPSRLIHVTPVGAGTAGQNSRALWLPLAPRAGEPLQQGALLECASPVPARTAPDRVSWGLHALAAGLHRLLASLLTCLPRPPRPPHAAFCNYFLLFPLEVGIVTLGPLSSSFVL